MKAKIHEVADGQWGLVTLAQALKSGMTEGMVRGQVASGSWERAGFGIYRIGAGPLRWTQRIWIACLETGGVASHRTAGQLHGLDGVGRNFKQIEVMVYFDSKRTASKAKVRRSRTLVDKHIKNPGGVPRTNLARTLIDLAGVLDEEDLALAYDSACRQRDGFRLWLRDVLAKMPRKGVKGRAALMNLIDENATVVESALEVKFRRLAKRAGLPAAIPQYDIFDDEEFITRVDFAWPDNDPPVALLGHGKAFHHDTPQWNLDNAHVRKLNAIGWRTAPCSYEDIVEHGEDLVGDIRRMLSGYQQPRAPKVVVYE
ncbi:MAG: type IV toxin-antitoxin system AbiEi family antitoxin domain-containing protein [Myxococcaceae bacterium]